MGASNTVSRAADAAERVLVIERVFDAPRELVFKLWTDPAHVKRWMGPRGFTAVHFEHEARPGGRWRGCLRPDGGGRDLWHGGVVREIVPPQRLVYSFAWDREDGSRGHETLVTITFEEVRGKTRMIFHQAEFDSVAQRDGHRGGWSSSFDRLAEYAATIRA